MSHAWGRGRAPRRASRFVERGGHRLPGPSKGPFLEPADLTRTDRVVVMIPPPGGLVFTCALPGALAPRFDLGQGVVGPQRALATAAR